MLKGLAFFKESQYFCAPASQLIHQLGAQRFMFTVLLYLLRLLNSSI